jgi:CheY-like chemotaxis protein
MKTRRILIAEDEETSRKVIALALGGDGHELHFAKDGDEVVRMAIELSPDLIIMDLMMPRTDGFKATQLIKKHPDLKNTPIVALTARTGEYDEARARQAGCDDYLTKPFRIGPLRERLARYL